MIRNSELSHCRSRITKFYIVASRGSHLHMCGKKVVSGTSRIHTDVGVQTFQLISENDEKISNSGNRSTNSDSWIC